MLRVALPPDLERERSIDVGQAAEILGCDHSTVRSLIRCEAIEGHRVGRTDRPGGIRVNLQSVLDYKARHAITVETEGVKVVKPVAVRRRRKPSTAAHREAMRQLRALGSRVV